MQFLSLFFSVGGYRKGVDKESAKGRGREICNLHTNNSDPGQQRREKGVLGQWRKHRGTSDGARGRWKSLRGGS